MLALLFLVDDVGMAGLAGVVAGEGHGPGGDLGDGGAAIVPVLPKAARDDDGAQDDECDQRDRHDGGEPDEVFNILEQVVFLRRTMERELRAKLRNALGYLVIRPGTMIEVTGACDGGHSA